MDFVRYIIDHSTQIIESGGLLAGFFLVVLECFIPALPLSVFVALNVNAFGFFVGCIISWIATCTGSFVCYKIFGFINSKLPDTFYNKKIICKMKGKIDKFKNIKFTELVLVMTLPFTPSSVVNILCGITNMNSKKFIFSLLIGKFFMIFFWGYIGKSFIESLVDLKSIIYILLTLLIAYIISKIINKKLNIE